MRKIITKYFAQKIHSPHSQLEFKKSLQDEDSSYVELSQRDNKEEVIKNLLQLYGAVDEGKTGLIPADNMVKQLLTEWDVTIQAGGLTEAEKRGFLAEMVVETVEDEQVVKFGEHVRTWIPLIFELRQNSQYAAILDVDQPFREAEIPLQPAQNRLAMMNRADSGGLQPVATGATNVQTLQVPDSNMKTRRSSLQGPPGAHQQQLDAQVRIRCREWLGCIVQVSY